MLRYDARLGDFRTWRGKLQLQGKGAGGGDRRASARAEGTQDEGKRARLNL